MQMSLKEIVDALGPCFVRLQRVMVPGQTPEEAAYSPIFGISTDTRTLAAGELFIALRSDKADGHDFLGNAIAKGAAIVVVSRPPSDVGCAATALGDATFRTVDPQAGLTTIHVTDTTVAYGRIARAWRDRFSIPVVGVTGSVGKTTVKEMLALTLSSLGPVLKTELSQNNETGVPKTLLQLDETHRAAVIEMGMRGRGQIADLCGIAAPTIGVITIISDNHAELLGSRDAIADAKGELLEALPEDGVAVLNADDPYVGRLRAKTKARVVTFGFSEDADYRAVDAQPIDGGWTFGVRVTRAEASSAPTADVVVNVPSPARHDISNALAAIAAAHAAGCSLADAAAVLARFAGAPMRMQITKTTWGTVMNDAYNAAPASVRSALETLKSMPGGRKIAFLGDMRELGEIAEDAHRALGDALATLGGLDALYTVGSLAALIPGAGEVFDNSAEAAEYASTMDLQRGDVILVKGSRAMAMEKVAQALLARGDAAC